MVPVSTSIKWALCVPSSCSHQEVKAVLQEELLKVFGNTEISAEVDVKENMCQVKDSERGMNFGAKLAM